MNEKYGCIGEHLKHSFSKEIHNALADYDYKIIEIPKDELDFFMEKKDFKAINVTIPYKERVIPHLDEIDQHAKLIGAVNTIVNRDGALFGYNTDFYGMTSLLSHAKIDPKNKKVAILGSGGTAKTAYAVLKALCAKEILTVSRTKKERQNITYDELYKEHTDVEIIINTTPVGMYPNIFDSPVDIDRFPKLSGVIDAIYNPNSTPLILAAKAKNIPAEGGLFMLVAQAVRASEIFIDTKYAPDVLESVFNEILSQKKNIVLTGMPGAGKSTVGNILAKKLGRTFFDTDTLIEARAGKPILKIFAEDGEDAFRDIETAVIKDVSDKCGCIIATGGGAILREKNVNALSENGKIYFIDRPLESLIPTNDRPLSNDRESITKRYNERYSIYCKTADVKISAPNNAEEVANLILGDFFNEDIRN